MKNKCKKVGGIALTVAVLLLMTLITACGGAPPPAPPPRPVEELPPPPPPPVIEHNRRLDIIIDGAQSYTVVQGDTLTSISRRLYNQEIYFPYIMAASSDVIRDPNRISPGMVLTIPVLDINLQDSMAAARIRSLVNDTIIPNYIHTWPSFVEDMRRFVNSL